MAKKALPVLIWKEEKWFVAKTLGIELASQGKTKSEAIKNLQEALELLLEDEGVVITQEAIPQGVELNKVYA